MFQLRLIDVTRTGSNFGTWLITNGDVDTAKQQFAHPTMIRSDALAYWKERGFRAVKLNAHEYRLEQI